MSKPLRLGTCIMATGFLLGLCRKEGKKKEGKEEIRISLNKKLNGAIISILKLSVYSKM